MTYEYNKNSLRRNLKVKQSEKFNFPVNRLKKIQFEQKRHLAAMFAFQKRKPTYGIYYELWET